MRVTSIALYSDTTEEPITFGLGDADRSTQYVVRAITGLDAEEIIPKFYASGLETGPKYYDFGLKPRDIVMRIVLEPRFQVNESIADARDELYRLISPSRTGLITIQFLSGGTTVAHAKGHVVKFEAVHFAAKPEVQLTIRCDDPMLKAINPVLLGPGELSQSNPVIIPDSISTAPHGFHMHVVFTQSSLTFTIQDKNADPEWLFQLVPNGGFLVGDELHISSDFAENHLYIDRGGSIIHLVDRLQPGSVWPIVFPGANYFYILEVSDGVFLFDWIDFEYYPAYWGV